MYRIFPTSRLQRMQTKGFACRLLRAMRSGNPLSALLIVAVLVFMPAGALNTGTTVPEEAAAWSLSVPDDPDYTSGGNARWWWANIDAEAAWAVAYPQGITSGVSPALVAVIDSGIDYLHPDLADNIWRSTVADNSIDGTPIGVPGVNFYSSNFDPNDDRFHGTHVAGIIGAVGNNGIGVTGVNWKARMMALKVSDAWGNAGDGNIAGAVNYARNHGAKVLNMSLIFIVESNTLKTELTNATNADILTVAGAGNSEKNNDLPENTFYPANWNATNAGIIAVAAVDQNDNKPSWSNYGIERVDIAAPGLQIRSTEPDSVINVPNATNPNGSGYGVRSGTSQATPFVVGVAALVRALYPNLTAVQVKQAILEGADIVPALSSYTAGGGRRLNAYGAVRRAAELANIPPVHAQVQSSMVIQSLTSGNIGRDEVRLLIADADQSFNSGQANITAVKIENLDTGEIERVVLTETGANTGIFQASLATVENGVAGPDDDGTLHIAAGQSLRITYIDALNAGPRPDTLTATVSVVNLFGDANNDGVIDLDDVTKILGISVGNVVPNSQETLQADVFGNGKIQAFDASLVFRYHMGVITDFPVRTRILSGAGAKNHPFKPAPMHRRLVLADMEAGGDGTYWIPLALDERSGIVSGDLHIGYEREVEVLEVIPGAGYEDYLLTHRSEPDGVRIALAGAATLAEGRGELARMRVRFQGETRFRIEEAFLNGAPVSTGLEIAQFETEDLPGRYALHPNMPNPFNPSTAIPYDIPEAGWVLVEIYTTTGQQIRTLVSGHQEAGAHRVHWDGKNEWGREVASGIFLVRMRAGHFADTRKIMLIR